MRKRLTKKRLKSSKHGRYLLSPKQMSEARHMEDVCNAQLKRGEIEEFGLFLCGCGCGVFGGGIERNIKDEKGVGVDNITGKG